jgi:transposase InsO family protein
MTATEKNLEILALRSQLSLYLQQVENKKIPKPRSTPTFRQLWVILSKTYTNWRFVLKSFVPDTVIGWHHTAFKAYWTKKSKKLGRPKVSAETIALIKRIHEENKMLSPEKIHEMLVSMNVVDPPAPNTIAKYFPSTRKPPTEKQIQSWKTFLKNHCKDIWAMDYLVVPTLKFQFLYVLIIINHATRKIENFSITANPNMNWLKQQIRNATPFGHKPKYLIHDNDSAFVSKEFQSFLSATDIKSKKTAYHCPWQNGIVERAVGIFRQELLNHIIPVNEKHLYRLLDEYVHKYYNTHRTHQGIGCKTPIPLPHYPETTIKNTELESTEILGGLYNTYNKVA